MNTACSDTIRLSRRLLGGAIAALLAGGAVGARAQDAGGGIVGIEEVVVTAQKRAENLQSVPVSVSALTENQLDRLKLDDSSALTSQIPNLQVNGIVGEASPVFSLRGVSMFDYSLNQSSPVAGYVDEVYKGNFAIFGVEMFDLARVEVLRGPQGTLYGKNTTGGAINFITRRPDFENEGYVRLGTGNYGRIEAAGALQGALVQDRVAARLAFTYTKADGWFKGVNGTPDMDAVDQYGVRLGVLFRANDDLDFLLRYTHSRQKANDYGIKAVPGPNGVGAGLYALFNSIDPVLNPKTDYYRAGLDDDQIETSYHPKRKQTTDGASLTVNWAISDAAALTSITSWDKGKLFNPEDTDGSPLQTAEIPYFGRTKQWTQDLRVASTGETAFSYIVGAYFSREKIFNSTELRLFNDIDINLDGAINFQDCLDGLDGGLGGAGCRFGNQFDQDRKSYAAYADTSYALTPAVKLRLGLRYTKDKGDQKNFVSQLRGPEGVPLANLIPGDPVNLDATASRSLSNQKVTGRLGLDFTLANGNLLYVNYSRGYRSGAFNAQAFFDSSELTVVKPETITSYEAGMKSQWLDDRLQLNLSVFRFTYKNQQVIDVDPITLAQPLKNLGSSRVSGAELELVARPVQQLTLRGGMGYLDAKLRSATLRGEDLRGKRLPNAPKLTATLSGDWDVVQVGNGQVTLHMDGSYAGNQYFEPFNVRRMRQDSYVLLNARLGFTGGDGAWEIAGWVRNLTDKFYITSAADLLGGFGFDYTHRGAPRTYGVEASYHF